MNKLESISTKFLKKVGYSPDLLQPKSFNEKIQWLKLFYQDPLLTRCSDKTAAKEYVREKVGRDICIPTLKTYNQGNELHLDELPAEFILKPNHTSGKTIICRDKAGFDLATAREKLARWLDPSSNRYFVSDEWAYRDIVPHVIAEPLIGNPDTLTDYKFLCYHGEPRCLFTATNRTKELFVDFFDTDWVHLPFQREYRNNPVEPPRPDKLEEMLAIARTLSADFPFVRVDLYCENSRIYFGELTFYPGNGMEPFTPLEWDNKLGEWLTLPEHALISPAPEHPPFKIPREHINAFIELIANDAETAKSGQEHARLRARIERM
ncbi:MAG: glycosyltransferase, partial [Rariglobus sp.]|nr:glycosyltransferase [Rariglobus sp.]